MMGHGSSGRALRAELDGLGLPAASVDRLRDYLGLVARWNEHINLTAARSARERVSVLIRNVLPALAMVPAGSLLDIGSGNGSPGLVLAILRPDLRATLLEPRVRRWGFLREAARVTGCEVQVLRRRHDEYDGPPADTVTIRGLRLPGGEIVGLIKPEGRLIVFGSSAHLGTTAGLSLVGSCEPGISCFLKRCST